MLLFLSGLIIGLVGMGGGILVLPLLNNAYDIPFDIAVFYTLIFSFLLSIIGLIFERRNLNYSLGIKYFLWSLIGVIAGSVFSHSVSIEVKEIGFTLVLFLSLLLSFLDRNKIISSSKTKFYFALICIFTGFVTSIFGVGGAFMIVPTLLYFYERDIKAAISTSFIVIALNCLFSIILKLNMNDKLDYFVNINIAYVYFPIVFLGFILGRKTSFFIKDDLHKLSYQSFIALVIIFSLF